MSMVGVLLAGGKSTRMKQDKALLQLNGSSLLQHQFNFLKSISGKAMFWLVAIGQNFPTLRICCLVLDRLKA
ncbi:MAG: NTP transferase domain-containing protein [Bdellovibrionaceae bacterium]|nr:NTP transferase domain-containing protein [Pseudobdellovibrionaceae bacterium]